MLIKAKKSLKYSVIELLYLFLVLFFCSRKIDDIRTQSWLFRKYPVLSLIPKLMMGQKSDSLSVFPIVSQLSTDSE